MDVFWEESEVDLSLGFEWDSYPATSANNDGENDEGVHEVPRAIEMPRASPSEKDKIRECVSSGLKSGKNILVECPPGHQRKGTILCTALEYVRLRRLDDSPSNATPKPTRVIFATEGVSATKRLLAEMRSTSWPGLLEGIKMMVVDHRKNMCINREVRGLDSNVDSKCFDLIRNENVNLRMAAGYVRAREVLTECPFHFNPHPVDFHYIQENPGPQDFVIRDMEDYINHCHELTKCPYFSSYENLEKADLIICPQDFVLSPVLREEHKINIYGAIIIFDDGHNLDLNCCTEGSVQFTTKDLNIISRALRTISTAATTSTSDFSCTIDNLIHVTTTLYEIVKKYQDHLNEREDNVNNLEGNSDLEDEVMEKLQISFFSRDQLAPIRSKLLHHAINTPEDDDSSVPYDVLQQSLKFLYILPLFADGEIVHQGNLSVQSKLKNVGRRRTIIILKIVCAKASHIFQKLGMAATSIIIGGDCLSPFYSFTDTSNFGLGVQFHAEEIWHNNRKLNERVFFASCERGPSDRHFQLNFTSRRNPLVQHEVITALGQLCALIPSGVVMIFHSESALKEMLATRPDRSNLTETIGELKRVFSLQRMQTEAEICGAMEEYKRWSKNPENEKTGAALILHRHNAHYISQLEGAEIRGVIHVGIPYRGWHSKSDERLVAKRDHFEKRFGEKPCEFLQWYRGHSYRQMGRSFAQVSDGEGQDWGVVILLDARVFPRGPHNIQEELVPAWVRANEHHYEGDDCFQRLTQKIQLVVNMCEPR